MNTKIIDAVRGNNAAKQARNTYDDIYLLQLRAKAKSWISTIDADEWLRQIRGYEM
jgi:hypothetical protein